jgi:hypothetical protein
MITRWSRWPTASLAAIAAVALSTGTASELFGEEPLVTDRPDFTESSSTVGKGHVQLEGGVTTAELDETTRVTTAGELLVRWGLTDRLEARFLLPTYAWESNGGPDVAGFVDSAIGIKYQLKTPHGGGVIDGLEASLIASTTLPTASGDFDSSKLQPVAVAAVSWELGRTTGLGMNFGIARPADDGDRFTSAWVSAALGVGLSDASSVFFELYGFDREEARGPNTLTFQTGLVHLLSDDLQLDLRLARRLSDDGPDLLIGAGVSWRWRNKR